MKQIIESTEISQHKIVKAVMLADLHLHHLPLWRLEWTENFIKELLSVFPAEIPLLLLGDVFEVQDKVDSRVLNQFLDLILSWNGRVIWLTGQHDSYMPGKATLEGLKALTQITIVDGKPFYDSCLNWWFVPFARSLEYYYEMLKTIPDNAMVMTHMPLKEALEKFTTPDDERYVKVEDFSRFKKVISGDIHGFTSFKNFHYVGAPSQRDWRDASVEGKIGVLYTDNTFDRISVDCPQHVKVTNLASLRRIGFDKELQQVIKVVSTDITGEQISALKKRPGILDVLWEPALEESIATEVEQDIENLQSDEEILSSYIDSIESLPKGFTASEVIKEGLNFINNED